MLTAYEAPTLIVTIDCIIVSIICILLGFGIGNLIGFGLWLYEYTHEKHSVKWYKDGKFWLWFFYTLLFGIAYAVLRLILYIKELINKKK